MTTAEATRATNVSLALRERAREHPDRPAVVVQGGASTSFGELDARCDALAHGLTESGLERGDRACLFVRPGAELIALTHALFRSGIVPVLIDPGMGRKNLLACVEKIAPRALIGVPRVHVARLLFPRAFRSVEIAVTVGRRFGWGGRSLADLERDGRPRGAYRVAAGSRDEDAAILFTSGSTGPPKGVTYGHDNFIAQLHALERLYELEPGEVDCACFPLFALFDNALGMTSVFPELDPSRPGECDPAKVYAAIESSGATFTFGSPAIWRRVHDWARTHGKRFSRLRRLTIAGAPVPPWLVVGLRELLSPGADVHTPYGATEALPVTNITGAEIEALRERIEGGEGTCVGRPVEGIEVMLQPVDRAGDGVGEVCVRGPVVTREYKFEPDATLRAKIVEGDSFWHRMGDVGRLDSDGRLWYLGRRSHRLETTRGVLMPVPTENVYNTVRGVRRSALVGVGPRGTERPYLVVEPDSRTNRRQLEAVLREQGSPVAVDGFLFRDTLPVDVRHNAKIHRGELKRWAEERVR